METDDKDKLLIEAYKTINDIVWKCFEIEEKLLKESQAVYEYQRRVDEESTY